MSTLSLRLPNYLHEGIRKVAEQQGVSINQLITLAVAEKLSALTTAQVLAQRTATVSRKEYEEILAKVPNIEPDPWDRLPEKINP